MVSRITCMKSSVFMDSSVLAVVGVGLGQLGTEGREAVVGVEGIHHRRDAAGSPPMSMLLNSLAAR